MYLSGGSVDKHCRQQVLLVHLNIEYKIPLNMLMNSTKINLQKILTSLMRT